ncbi:hypothetical protein WN093_14045 [Gammaproteobacteria bacterium AS21]
MNKFNCSVQVLSKKALMQMPSKALPALIVIALFYLLFIIIKQQVGDFSALTATRTKSQYVQCPLQSQLSCTIKTGHGDITLHIDETIQSLVNFNVQLETNTPYTLAKLRFEGFDDYMGITHLIFNGINSVDIPTHQYKRWQTQGSIPVCTTDSNMWRVTLNLHDLNTASSERAGSQAAKNTVKSYWFKLKTP